LNPRTGARLCRRPAAAIGPALRPAFSTVALRFIGRAGVRGEEAQPLSTSSPNPNRSVPASHVAATRPRRISPAPIP
jgi:hypothetical protein